MMKCRMKEIQAVAFGCAAFILLSLLVWQGQSEAASDCYLKCFMTNDGARVCVVEGHRLYEQITVRVENGDQCFSSVEQGRAAGFLVLGAPKPESQATQAAPEAAPAQPTETPEPIVEDTPEPAADTTPEITEPEPPVETAVPETSDASEEQPEEVVEAVVEEAPSSSEPDDGMTPRDREKQALIAKMGDENLSMEEREQAYQQLMNLPGLTEEEKQGIQFLWDMIAGSGMQDMVIGMLKAVLLGPVGIGLLVILLFFIICGWIIFAKAGVPGILSLIPIVNVFFMVKISGKPIWWFILLFIPVVNIIISLLLCLGLAERFGKGALMGLVLFFLPFIGLPILAFTGEYQG